MASAHETFKRFVQSHIHDLLVDTVAALYERGYSIGQGERPMNQDEASTLILKIADVDVKAVTEHKATVRAAKKEFERVLAERNNEQSPAR